jgi:hypothetical protein
MNQAILSTLIRMIEKTRCLHGPRPCDTAKYDYCLLDDKVRITHSFAIALKGIIRLQKEISGHNLLTHYVKMHPDASSPKRMTFGF